MISRKIALIAAFCFTVLGCSEEQSAPAKTKTIESIAAASERLEGSSRYCASAKMAACTC